MAPPSRLRYTHRALYHMYVHYLLYKDGAVHVQVYQYMVGTRYFYLVSHKSLPLVGSRYASYSLLSVVLSSLPLTWRLLHLLTSRLFGCSLVQDPPLQAFLSDALQFVQFAHEAEQVVKVHGVDHCFTSHRIVQHRQYTLLLRRPGRRVRNASGVRHSLCQAA